MIGFQGLRWGIKVLSKAVFAAGAEKVVLRIIDNFLDFSDLLLQLLNFLVDVPSGQIFSLTLALFPLVRSLDLLELVWGHVLLQNTKVRIIIFSKIEAQFVPFCFNYRLQIKVWRGVKLDESLIFLVEYHKKNVLVTLGGEFYTFFENSSLSFKIGNSVLFIHKVVQ